MTTSATLVASTVMDTAAALNNDSAKSRYTYAIQIPYLNIALRELQEYFELNNIPVTNDTSAVINLPAGTTTITYQPTVPVVGVGYLPDDLVEPNQLWERLENTNPYTPMQRVDVLPLTESGTLTSQFLIYIWAKQQIEVLESNQDNDIKIDYTRHLFATVTSSTDVLGVVNAQSFLEFRTGGLLAQFIGEDDKRAMELNSSAGLSLDRALGIGTKGRQAIMTRRRPFRSSFKRGSM